MLRFGLQDDMSASFSLVADATALRLVNPAGNSILSVPRSGPLVFNGNLVEFDTLLHVASTRAASAVITASTVDPCE